MKVNKKLRRAVFFTTLSVIPISLIWFAIGILFFSYGRTTFLSTINEVFLQLAYMIPVVFLFSLLVLIPSYFLFEKLQVQKLFLYLSIGVITPAIAILLLFWRQVLNSILAEKFYYFSLPVFYGLLTSIVFYYFAVRKINKT